MTYLLHSISEVKHNSNYNTPEEIAALPRDSVLTFDGVYMNMLPHLKLLSEYPFGILFPTGFMGEDNSWDSGQPRELFCDWTAVDHILDHTGWKIGWHSWGHVDLTECDSEELADQLIKPFHWGGSQVEDFAYPYGKFDECVIEAVKRAGYKRAWSVGKGDNSPYQLTRRHL